MFNWALVLSLCMLVITIMDNRARGSILWDDNSQLFDVASPSE